jgi:bacteriocin-like protein
MKKQNLNGKLAFNKAVIAELNETDLKQINGGTGITTLDAITNNSSGYICEPIINITSKLGKGASVN